MRRYEKSGGAFWRAFPCYAGRPCSTDQSPHAAAVNAPAANCAKSWAKAGARRGKGQVRKRENPALWFAAAGLNGSVLDAMLTSIHCLGLGYAAPHATPLQQFVVRPRGHL